MRIKNAVFERSYKDRKDYFNEGLPEIAVVGKSNVGKSSLINSLTGNGKLARVSKQPGKTRMINYFRLNLYPQTVQPEKLITGIDEKYADFQPDQEMRELSDKAYLVDLPGYGFARVSKAEKDTWNDMMRGYFEISEYLRVVLILMDIRHKPTAEDKAMVEYVEYFSLPYIIVATKADKIAKSRRKSEAEKLRKEIRSSFAYDIIPVSSEIGYGKENLLDALDEYLTD